VNEWYYALNNEQKGPVNEAELKEMLAGNQVPTGTLVWQEGMANWAPANSLPAFTFRAPPMPAAARPAPPVPAASPAPASPPMAAATVAASRGVDVETTDAERNKVFAILAYVWILFLVPLLAAKDSPFARYHANQGLTLFLAWIFLEVARTILFYIPGVGWILALSLFVVNIGLLVLMIIGIMNAAQGKMEPLPVIGQYTLLK
jgi:uncharacterized membrane protein